MGASTYANQLPLLKINLFGKVKKVNINACDNGICESFQKETENRFCGSCGEKIKSITSEIDLEMNDLLAFDEGDLDTFQIFEDNEWVNLDDYDLDKNRERDIYIISENNDSQGPFNRYHSLFEEKTEEEKIQDIEYFKVKHKLFLEQLNKHDVDFELKTRIIIQRG